MAKRTFLFSIILSLLLVNYGLPSFAQNYNQSLKYGRIDWSNGIIESIGEGIPPSNPANSAQARAVAERKAVEQARRNLLEILESIHVDSRMLIRDIIDAKKGLRASLQELIRKTPVADISYKENGAVEATLAVEMNGVLAELILPGSIRNIESVVHPNAPDPAKGKGYTGLIIDCRGFHVKPALVPIVQDEEGQVVYGPAYVSREYAVRKGVARYVPDLEAAKACKRVAGNPLIIKGVRKAGGGISDVVISNSDAAKIRGTPRHLSLLQKCKVVLVID
ncbi:MAG: hypothetical protein JRH13_09140 [Deltaproteobacteria bacterium]|nr:hypothetical protein [Deltaproteobacteria bacterium]MBW2016579.1 hypothetical protein [Deltaproteobacteria bacterium]MBW2129515.1 hypothetical protein [Deltaproteobacteria bacterium]MBW2304715.1 hypothetical protein [Deltaproteobacteria bacterium]